ncbi:MAG TPA: DUF305 domain-containing protein [Candidatus Limnocylindrales bacterium]|nr:DUF305 domain-containing protein [Candidatus Limnocylindrales bacterium]
MDTKPLLYGLIGFFIGGLLVSVAATTFDKESLRNTSDSSNNHSVESLTNKTGDEFDKAFMEEMIAHHQSAIDMAKLAETNAKHDEIKKLSTDILSAQSAEIDMMQTWQGDWGYKTVPKSHNSGH